MSRAESHAELVERAARWLRNSAGCSFVATEIASSAWESPDAIGWRNATTIVVECKTSRSDFRADAKKPWRRGFPALGTYRYMMAPAGLLTADEMPPGWGLLEVSRRRVIRACGMDPHRNCDPQGDWQHESNAVGETKLLLSALKRLELSIGEKDFRRMSTQSYMRAKEEGQARLAQGGGQ